MKRRHWYIAWKITILITSLKKLLSMARKNNHGKKFCCVKKFYTIRRINLLHKKFTSFIEVLLSWSKLFKGHFEHFIFLPRIFYLIQSFPSNILNVYCKFISVIFALIPIVKKMWKYWFSLSEVLASYRIIFSS